MNVAITGGARGIGRACAEACLRAGMRVAIGDLDRELVEFVAQEISGDAVGLVVDVRDRESFLGFLDGAERAIGALDALVNNAGVLFVGPFAAEDPARTRQTVEVNLLGIMTGTQLALQRFLPRQRGHIVNLASSAGLAGVAGGATYSATKHGVVGLTRAVRAESRGTGVRTTIVMPGIVRTDMIGGLLSVRGTRIIAPSAVGEAIAKALRTGRPEVIVPRELGSIARLAAGLPPRASDLLKRLIRADAVMGRADLSARGDYERRVRPGDQL